MLCGLSILLTGLFAVSLASSSLGLPVSIVGERWIATLLMVLIGVSIDMSKYLLWREGMRQSNIALVGVSVVLLAFSWCASVAFFVSQESNVAQNEWLSSGESMAKEKQITAMEEIIEANKALIANKMRSKFHGQWDEAEKLTAENKVLADSMVLLLTSTDLEGRFYVKRSRERGTLFSALATPLNLSSNTVRNVFYAILAFFIEVCAIALIYASDRGATTVCEKNVLQAECEVVSIVTPSDNEFGEEGVNHEVELNSFAPIIETPDENEVLDEIVIQDECEVASVMSPIDNDFGEEEVNSEAELIGFAPITEVLDEFGEDEVQSSKVLDIRSDVKRISTIQRLKSDIEEGVVEPTVRRLVDKSGDYGLGHSDIRKVLVELYNEGIIVNGPRNSYRLKERDLAAQT